MKTREYESYDGCRYFIAEHKDGSATMWWTFGAKRQFKSVRAALVSIGKISEGFAKEVI